MLSYSTLRQRRSQKSLSSPRPRQHAYPPPLRRRPSPAPGAPPRRRPPPAPFHLRRDPLAAPRRRLLLLGAQPIHLRRHPDRAPLARSRLRLPRLLTSSRMQVTAIAAPHLLRPFPCRCHLAAPFPRLVPSNQSAPLLLQQESWLPTPPPIPLAKSAHMCDNSLQPNPRRPSANSRQPQ